MLWVLILTATLIATIAGFMYLVSRFKRFSIIKKIRTKKIKNLAGIAVVIGLFGIIWLWIGPVNAMICIIHLTIFWLIIDGLVGVLFRRKKIEYNYVGISAIVFTIVYLACGWCFAHHVWQTNYIVSSEKIEGDLRIIQFADSHVGTTFNAKGFEKHLRDIQKTNPDIILITGDFVDDSTTREDMIESCKALGGLKSTYGTYFSFGNHDKGYYNGRGYTGDELTEELRKNGINVLEDETVLVDEKFYVIGRQDRSENDRGNERADIVDLASVLDKNKFIIVMDHQPNDYDREIAANVDLVLSGHTHGGQLFPIIKAGEWIGANDKTYGYERREKTSFIVTSGISDWEIKFKTGCKSEYVVIDIHGE